MIHGRKKLGAASKGNVSLRLVALLDIEVIVKHLLSVHAMRPVAVPMRPGFSGQSTSLRCLHVFLSGQSILVI